MILGGMVILRIAPNGSNRNGGVAPAFSATPTSSGGVTSDQGGIVPTPAAASGTGGAIIAGETVFPRPVQGHIPGSITYPHNPPPGGVHNKEWQNCGVYDQPVPNEVAVHAREHGAVWMTYQPTLAADQVQILRGITRGSAFRLLSPYANLGHPLIVAAGGYQLPLDRADDPRLSAFIQAHEQDPSGPEPGAPCTGSTGTPLP